MCTGVIIRDKLYSFFATDADSLCFLRRSTMLQRGRGIYRGGENASPKWAASPATEKPVTGSYVIGLPDENAISDTRWHVSLFHTIALLLFPCGESAASLMLHHQVYVYMFRWFQPWHSKCN